MLVSGCFWYRLIVCNVCMCSGLTLSGVMSFLTRGPLRHSSGDVRDKAEELITLLYKKLGAPVRQYLLSADEQTRKSLLYKQLFKAFDECDVSRGGREPGDVTADDDNNNSRRGDSKQDDADDGRKRKSNVRMKCTACFSFIIATSLLVFFFSFFFLSCTIRRAKCHAPVGDISRHQSPDWTIVSHVNCFIQREVIGFWVLLDSLQPRSTGAFWWSPPVLQGEAVKIFLASVSSGIRGRTGRNAVLGQ